MPLAFGVDAIREARRREARQRAWEQWVAASPFMDRASFLPFERFYQEQEVPQSHRPAEAVLAEADRIRRKVRLRRRTSPAAEQGI